MGADRRGPLAAFILLAIIAAVLLVTSVRSQASPHWLDPDKIPASVVAAAPVTEPHLWDAVTGGVQLVVQDGIVLALRATPGSADETGATTEALDSSSSVTPPATTGDADESETDQVARTHRSITHSRHATTPGRLSHDASRPTADAATAPSGPTARLHEPAAVPVTHDHGRHLGWSHGHPSGHDVGVRVSGHGHPHGHAYGHLQHG